ncbi:DUF1254 domain-containing protein [Achromobacter pestifer]|uniref:DUF1254 domain-containing protein n=1 Tax=Achromobacter pestifer TaxID=1353889 RepID=A0A6S6Z075_9BURK|nr:DUF1254 domain-containing protein [Achromobacter pestifer]CAB3646345.1 hypothetical protein LMG3431_02464 [Achromobacter pestifer]
MRDRQSSTGFSQAAGMVPARWIITALLAGGLAGCSFTSPDEATGSQSVGIQGVTAQQARSIAREAYLYGTPMVASYQTMYAFSIDQKNPQYKGPFNTVNNIARVFSPDDTALVTPNADTPYSFAVLDLRAEPVVISVPPMEKRRYFVLQLMDLYTYNFAYIGSRTTGNDGGRFLIAGPRWNGSVPKGITKVIKSETELVNMVGRTQLFNAADLENVKRIQARYKIQPLSAFTRRPAPPAPAAVDWIAPVPPGEMRTSLEFYNQLAFLLQFAPTHPTEKWLRERFASIGLKPGQPFNVDSRNPALRRALQEGMHTAQNDIDKNRTTLGGKTDTLFGDRNTLKNDYLSRATGAQIGIGANSRDEALYPVLEKDSRGQDLDGRYAYTLRFAPRSLPPVNAFWSVTMYRLPDQLLAPNPINRYLINSSMLPSLKKDADGGLTLYIQAQSPGTGKESNWLPAPEGPFMVTMRYYWPKPDMLNGKWVSPEIERVAK